MQSDEYEAYYFKRGDITLEIIQEEIKQAKKKNCHFLLRMTQEI